MSKLLVLQRRLLQLSAKHEVGYHNLNGTVHSKAVIKTPIRILYFKCFEKILTHSILVSFPAAVIKYSDKVNYGEDVSMAHNSSSEPTRKGKWSQELPGAGHMHQIKKQRPVGKNAHASVQITFCALCSPGTLAWGIRMGLPISVDINKIANNNYAQRPISRVVFDTQFAISVNHHTQNFHVFKRCFAILPHVFFLCNAQTCLFFNICD